MNRKVLQPLSRRLPLLMTVLLSIIVAGVSWSAYVEIRRATLDATRAHLENAAQQIASLLDASVPKIHHDLATVGSDPRIIAGLRDGTPKGDSAVVAALGQLNQRSTKYLALAVWNRKGERIATVGSAGVAQSTGADLITAAKGPRSLVSRLVVEHDSAAYGIVAPAISPEHDTLGFVVGARGLSDSASAAALDRLLGRGARLLLGNATSDVWTDLSTVVTGPPAAVVRGERSSFETTNGVAYVGAGSHLSTSPWIVWVDAPESVVLGTARGFLAAIIGVGLVFIFVGALGAWVITRRATRPLDELRRATEALTANTAPRPVTIRGDDEISGLSRSFNAMADHVRVVNQELLDRAAALERRNEELRDSERRYRQLVDQSPDGVLVHRDATIIYANAVAVGIVGAPDQASLIGRSILDLVDEEHRDEARRRIQAVQASRTPSRPAEFRLRRLDGSTVTAEVNGSPIVFDGQPAVQTLARDVSERKVLEEQLRQSQKMEAVGRLAGGIAHDFNNLLTIINTYAELTLGRMANDDPARADIQDIHRAGLSATKLTRQMLAFSRKQVLAPRMLDVNDAITGLAGMLQRVLGEEVHVVTKLRPALGLIWADAGQLEQVLMNLAVNARDAMPRGGTVKIETGEVELGEGNEAYRRLIPPGRYVMLGVSDTGIGMTEEVKAHIFEPFFTTKHPGQGTGLGLATVYGIVKQSGGYIWVYSEPGQGSSFKIYFPLYSGADSAIPTATSELPIPARRAANVLLVEDDVMVRAAVRRILERSPHQICEAQSGADAIELFRERQGRIDLIVTDMVMPSMTGAELVRELREWNPVLRAIIMSGYSEETTSRDWRLPENSVFLEKPVSPTRLLRAVSDALGVGSD